MKFLWPSWIWQTENFKEKGIIKNTVHIVLKSGAICEAYGEGDTELIVYDLDTEDPEMKAEIERTLSAVRAKAENRELEIF